MTSTLKQKFKYRTGDCLSFKCADNSYIVGIVTDTYKSYYDITLIEYRQKQKPVDLDVIKAKFFGTREGSIENIDYLADKQMVKRTYIDKSEDIELICFLHISRPIGKASYQYANDIEELLKYYLDELPVRIEKTKNADQFPEIGFMSRHLISVRQIAEKTTKC